MLSAIRYFLLPFFAVAVRAQSVQEKPRFAPEVQTSEEGRPHYGLVPSGTGTASSTFFSAVLTSLPGEDTARSEEEKPCAPNLDHKEDGDAVSIAAYVYYRGCDGQLFN